MVALVFRYSFPSWTQTYKVMACNCASRKSNAQTNDLNHTMLLEIWKIEMFGTQFVGSFIKFKWVGGITVRAFKCHVNVLGSIPGRYTTPLERHWNWGHVRKRPRRHSYASNDPMRRMPHQPIPDATTKVYVLPLVLSLGGLFLQRQITPRRRINYTNRYAKRYTWCDS